MQLASRFGNNAPVLRSHEPLSDDAIRQVAPSIFAEEAHTSRSARYSYIRPRASCSSCEGRGFNP